MIAGRLARASLAPVEVEAEVHAAKTRAAKALPRLIVDHSHVGRHVTGIERIALELFSPEALSPFAVETVRTASRKEMVVAQNFGLPRRALADPSAIVLCPGFPPSLLLSLFGERVVPYIHDLFLLTRPQDLNIRAKLYMVAPFRAAVRRLPRFFVNSQATGQELRAFCRPDAEIVLYRPKVRNVFGLGDAGRERPLAPNGELRLVALGTVEPRKNLAAAADIVEALRASGFPGASLDIVGRVGWGDDAERLAARPGVTLHGYRSVEEIRAIVDAADVFINTSHDEGLGLPLLEAQYAGLPVVAPQKTVFAEVLGESGLLIDPADPRAAAARIAGLVAGPGWRKAAATAAAANLVRWNDAADGDHAGVIDMLLRLAASRARA
ncbi:MAG: glycosyltransferase [Hyphomicrobiales bacterium]